MTHEDQDDVRRIVLSVLDGCSTCGRAHELDDLRVVGRSGTLWMLGVTCPSCNSQSFVAAVVGDQADVDPDVSSFDDADVEPALSETGEPVTVDDVLDMHEFLESFNGDFHRLFARRR